MRRDNEDENVIQIMQHGQRDFAAIVFSLQANENRGVCAYLVWKAESCTNTVA